MADPLEQLYTYHKHSIYRYFLRLTSNTHLAEDLTQETFFKAFKGMNHFRGDSSLKTWLFKIAHNTYVNDVRKKARQMEEQVDLMLKDLSDKQNDYKAIDEQMMIQQILTTMNEKERTFLLLRDFQQFTYGEIAKILKLTEGQVKVGIYRARKSFTTLYRRQEGEGEE
ncbi:RNA polymerase sigma factor [Salirhabdus salicampi]|uniref:RNA polymerase sigma factor n=1 Tax=Salirhabdus salicampi TaxID=476102 RepID=UPI0020C4F63E|nr:RNA polymerase sigma factor [Salirhabdus salicampi]MCP8617275.1 RNA polymerase sigma factor [Salirhabdus salicampi]